jgi:hypothetical protein
MILSGLDYVALLTCKKCGDINYLTTETVGNLTDFSFKCWNCNTINRTTLRDGELKKQESPEFQIL